MGFWRKILELRICILKDPVLLLGYTQEGQGPMVEDDQGCLLSEFW